MLEFLRRLLWDESAFERWGRVAIFLLGEGIRNGTIPLPPNWAWVGGLLQAGALLVAAGQKNASEVSKTDSNPGTK